MANNNYWYKKHCVIIFMMRSQYNWNLKNWKAYWIDDYSNSILIAYSRISLKDVREKVRKFIDEKERNEIDTITETP